MVKESEKELFEWICIALKDVVHGKRLQIKFVMFWRRASEKHQELVSWIQRLMNVKETKEEDYS